MGDKNKEQLRNRFDDKTQKNKTPKEDKDYDSKKKPQQSKQQQSETSQGRLPPIKRRSRGNVIYLFVALGLLYMIKEYFFAGTSKEDRKQEQEKLMQKFHKMHKKDEHFQNKEYTQKIAQYFLNLQHPSTLRKVANDTKIEYQHFDEQLSIRDDFCLAGDAFKLEYPEFVLDEKYLKLIQNKEDQENPSQKYQVLKELGEDLFPVLQDTSKIANKTEIKKEIVQMRATIVEPFNIQNHKYFFQNNKFGKNFFCSFQFYNTIPGLFVEDISEQKYPITEKNSVVYQKQGVILKMNVIIASTNPLIVYMQATPDLDKKNTNYIQFLQEQQILQDNFELSENIYEEIQQYIQNFVQLQKGYILKDSRVFQHFQVEFFLQKENKSPTVYRFIDYPQNTNQENLYADLLEIELAYTRSRFYRLQFFAKQLYSKFEKGEHMDADDVVQFQTYNRNKLDAFRELRRSNSFIKIYEEEK